MKVYKVTPDADCNSCIEKNLDDIFIWFEDAEPGSVITVKVLEMSEEEYNTLPEFMGP